MLSSYLTIPEAVAKGYGNKNTIRAWIYRGKLPTKKWGRDLFIKEQDLKDYGHIPPIKDIKSR